MDLPIYYAIPIDSQKKMLMVFQKLPTSNCVFTPTSVPALWLWSHPEFASAPLEPAELFNHDCGKIFQKPMGHWDYYPL